jgi:DNA-binding LacI/PurR family transcriptional regulator
MIPIKRSPLFRQVEEYVRSQVASGAYPPFSKLPSTRDLMALTGTSFCTVRTAVSKLCREGLLESHVGDGTYVKGGRSQLGCAGLYFRHHLTHYSRFYHVLGEEICRQLKESGVRYRVWTNEREADKFPGPPESLVRAMDRRDIQALISPLSGGPDLIWMEKAPVPVSVLTSDLKFPSGVGGSFRDMLKLGLSELQRQGCRSLGVISSMLLEPEKTNSAQLDFYRALVEYAKEMGLEVRNEWIRFPAEMTPHFNHFGYEQFHALWKLDNRPDGLFVFPDDAAAGVITAILEKGVSVPRDLKVAFHANNLVPYVCPFEATFLCVQIEETAKLMIDMVREQLAGATPRRGLIPFSLIQGRDPFKKITVPALSLIP